MRQTPKKVMEEQTTAEFLSAEQRVEAQSAGFKKELGLTDLVLTQILFIVGLGWVGVAGKQGQSHIVLWNASGVFYALTYLVMFAIPIIGLRSSGVKVPLWHKVASFSGFTMTLLFVALSIVPIVQVESQLAFAAKLGGLIIVTNLIGVGFYLVAKRRRSPYVE